MICTFTQLVFCIHKFYTFAVCVSGINSVSFLWAISKVSPQRLPLVYLLFFHSVCDHKIIMLTTHPANVHFLSFRCSESERYRKVAWKDVRVGDIVHLSNNETVPADILLLRSSNPHGVSINWTFSLSLSSEWMVVDCQVSCP